MWAAGRFSKARTERPREQGGRTARGPRRGTAGHTLIEALLVVGLLSLALGVVTLNVFGMLGRAAFDEDVAQFARVLRTAAEEAVFRGTTLAVVIDVTDGYYTVYEATTNDVYDEQSEPLIAQAGLDQCYIDDIEYADGGHQFSGQVVLHATPQGWENSWLFTLIDLREQLRWVRCDRLTTRVTVRSEPLELPEALDEVSRSAVP